MRTVSISMLICLISLASSAAQSTAQSEQERNKAVARSFFENVLDQGHLNEYSDSHAANFVAMAAVAITVSRKTWPPPGKNGRPFRTCE